MRGAIYSRVSTEIQDYGKQTDELKDYAARNNIEVNIFLKRKFLVLKMIEQNLRN